MTNNTKPYTLFDRALIELNHALNTIFVDPAGTGRENPADTATETKLDEHERRHAAGLMRINHAGEVAAQALYQGQAATARLTDVRNTMQQAAEEENDHLRWCSERIRQLDNHTSVLNPLWYAGSFAIGAMAGALGDKWSLGFVVETERQVVEHLDAHLRKLPQQDEKSRAIIEQMKEDEAHHATVALESGGASLPVPVKIMMRITSKVMTTTAYRL